MKILPITFNILTICGFWRPISCESLLKKIIYSFYSLFMTFFILTFTLSHLIDIIMSANNLEDLTGSCFMLLSMLNVCCKMTNILWFRKNISELIDVLVTSHCKARDANELNVQRKFHKKARFVTICYATLTEATCMLITIRTFFGCTQSILPFRAWIPYEITSRLRYWLTFSHQTIAHVGAANLQIANETLICGLMIQACSQLELLKYRLKRIPQDIKEFNFSRSQNSPIKDNNYSKKLLMNCVEHHREVIEFAKKLNHTFNIIIFFQFVISSLVLCSSVYLLSKMSLVSVQFMSLSLYLSCMLYQIFLFCWYGNELIIQSVDVRNAVYSMDWMDLSLKDRKNLIIAMQLIGKPIKITSSFLITLSIDSYSRILRTSYSVFNLLQRTSG